MLLKAILTKNKSVTIESSEWADVHLACDMPSTLTSDESSAVSPRLHWSA